MKGHVDEELRALVELQIGGSSETVNHNVRAWIDTAFNGGLVLPQVDIERLACESAPLLLRFWLTASRLIFPLSPATSSGLAKCSGRKSSPTRGRSRYSAQCC